MSIVFDHEDYRDINLNLQPLRDHRRIEIGELVEILDKVLDLMKSFGNVFFSSIVEIDEVLAVDFDVYAA